MAREIVLGTAHHYNWVIIGAAINHPEHGQRLDLSQATNAETQLTDTDVIIYPNNGYGNSDLIRYMLKNEKPDGLMFFTDPRYYDWLFAIENEVRKQIPMIYLNIWDDLPAPLYNRAFYESCDTLLAISKQTKNINEMVLGKRADGKLISYVPHGINEKQFFPVEDKSKLIPTKQKLFGDKEFDFIVFFNSRNIRRKCVSDLMAAHKMFLDSLPKEKADKVALVLHTQVIDGNGTDLDAVKTLLFGPNSNIFFSDQRIDTAELNNIYNIADVTVLPSSNEGWGLALTEAMMAGKMIIANVTGGMQDQMGFKDENNNWFTPSPEIPSNHTGKYKKHGEWAFPVFPTSRVLQGSPPTPYIWDDTCRAEDAAEQIMNVYKLTPEERKVRGLKGREWAINEAGFTGETQGKRVIEAFDELFSTWQPREKFELINTNEISDRIINHELLY
jgi:glycosyltransferase involved in cell wall biosynthesis